MLTPVATVTVNPNHIGYGFWKLEQCMHCSTAQKGDHTIKNTSTNGCLNKNKPEFYAVGSGCGTCVDSKESAEMIVSVTHRSSQYFAYTGTPHRPLIPLPVSDFYRYQNPARHRSLQKSTSHSRLEPSCLTFTSYFPSRIMLCTVCASDPLDRNTPLMTGLIEQSKCALGNP
jgi:hypothetical protein